MSYFTGLLMNKKVTSVVSGGVPAFDEFASSTGSTSASTQTINITIDAGDTLVVATKWEDADRTVTCSSNIDGSFTALTKHNVSLAIFGQMFYKIGLTAGTHTITVDYGAATAFVVAGAWELSGVTNIDNEEPAPGSGDFSSTVSTGSITLDSSPEVFCVMSANYAGVNATPKSGWTEDFDPGAFQCQHLVTSGTGTEFGQAGINSGALTEIILGAAFK